MVGKLKKGIKGGGFKAALGDIATSKDADVFNFTDTETAINDYLYTVIQKLQESLKEKDNNARGVLSDGIEPVLISNTNGKIHMAIRYEDYGVGVDEGTKPKGFTKENRGKLLPEIYDWVRNKPSLQSIASNKKKKLSFAYAVTTNILKKGTKGSHWLTDVVGKSGEKLSNDLSQVLSAVLNRDIEVSVTKQTQKMLNGGSRNSR